MVLRKGRFFLIHDALDGREAQEAHTARWTVRCPDALRETEGRAVVSGGTPGLRVVPAWPDRIAGVETGWGLSMVPMRYQADMSPQEGRTCHARFVQRIEPGETIRFLMLMIAGDCPDAAIRAEVTADGLEVDVTAWGESEKLQIEN